MKASSLSNSSIEPLFVSDYEADSFLTTVQRMANSLVKLLDRIGTSIALGESGDLEAAHAFRRKISGK